MTGTKRKVGTGGKLCVGASGKLKPCCAVPGGSCDDCLQDGLAIELILSGCTWVNNGPPEIGQQTHNYDGTYPFTLTDNTRPGFAGGFDTEITQFTGTGQIFTEQLLPGVLWGAYYFGLWVYDTRCTAAGSGITIDVAFARYRSASFPAQTPAPPPPYPLEEERYLTWNLYSVQYTDCGQYVLPSRPAFGNIPGSTVTIDFSP